MSERPKPGGQRNGVQRTGTRKSGQRRAVTFRKTRADTGGDLLVVDVELTPDGHVPGAHVHPHQEERFEVLSGVMKFKRGLKTVVARAGDVVVVAPGTVHRFRNGGSEPARMRVEIRPALQMEELFETTVALAREGRTDRRGMPKPLDLALFMSIFDAEVRAPFAPNGLVRAVMAPVTWLARRSGLDARYRRPVVRAPQARRDSRRPRPSFLRPSEGPRYALVRQSGAGDPAGPGGPIARGTTTFR